MKSQSITFIFFAALCGMLYCLPNEAFTSDSKAKGIFIIGNKELPFDSLSRNELNDIFHCRKTVWDDNQKIEIAILKGSKINHQFVRYYIRETSTQDRKYWKNNLLGRDCQRITFRSEKSLVSHVALTKGSIGYISSHTKPVGVKVIKIIDKY
jgi:ABC-type phosphate transport system substrate-binding protein